MDDLDPRSMDYPFQSGNHSTVMPISIQQQRSISRTSICSTSSSDQDNGVQLSTLEPVVPRNSQSMAEIEIVSNGTNQDGKNDENRDFNNASQ